MLSRFKKKNSQKVNALARMDSSLKFEQQKLLLNAFKDNSLRNYHRNLQKPVIEILKVKLSLAPEIMKNVFPTIENPYD